MLVYKRHDETFDVPEVGGLRMRFVRFESPKDLMGYVAKAESSTVGKERSGTLCCPIAGFGLVADTLPQAPTARLYGTLRWWAWLRVCAPRIS